MSVVEPREVAAELGDRIVLDNLRTGLVYLRRRAERETDPDHRHRLRNHVAELAGLVRDLEAELEAES